MGVFRSQATRGKKIVNDLYYLKWFQPIYCLRECINNVKKDEQPVFYAKFKGR
jgi:hypothetical protein